MIITISVLSFIFFLFIHFVFWQFESIKYRGIFLMIKLCFIVSLLSSFLGLFYYKLPPVEFLPCHLSITLFSLLFYMHFYVGVERSVSIRILGEILNHQGSMSYQELEKVYPAKSMFIHRLHLLKDKGWLKIENNQFTLKTKGIRLAKTTQYIRNLYKLVVTG